ncbi:MAG: ring,2-phenylacetyl-CoA epoxidase subunit PaaC [Pseudonocardiales bacterium]|nr:ring,2-phenylacetyl-CoA epoxidase subunit PaaC [Pseudonocardiales bacterium]
MHEDENAYESLSVAHGGEERWAFGTGFDDPLAGVDAAIIDGVDPAALGRECVALGDDALVVSQRLAAWCSNAPELEDEVALANIALDLLGQARLLLTRAARADPGLRPPDAPAHIPAEDALVYFRDASAFRNVCLAELDDAGDFATAIARLLLFVTWRLAVMGGLTASADPVLAAIAAKGVTELTYHREYAAGWTVRLGDGTDYSRGRMQAALDRVWPYVDELFAAADVRAEFDDILAQVLAAATLTRPSPVAALGAGRRGEHTGALAPLLEDLQSVARADPAATW